MATPEWSGLLKWTLRHHDGTAPSDPSRVRMRAEDQKWLEAVMKDLVMDPIDRMKVLVTTLRVPERAEDLPASLDVQSLNRDPKKDDSSSPAAAAASDDGADDDNSQEKETSKPMTQEELAALVISKKIEALEELDDFVAQIDLASDLHKIGGFVPLLECLTSGEPRIQAGAAQVLSTVVQNNPGTQRLALELGALGLLQNLLRAAVDSGVQNKAILAVSSVVRHCDEAEGAFLADDGYALLAHLLTSPTSTNRVKRKSLALLQYFWRKKQYARLSGARTIVSGIVSLIGCDDVDLCEMSLQSLLQLHGNDKRNLRHARELKLAETLQRRRTAIQALTDPEDIDAASVELDLLNELLRKIA